MDRATLYVDDVSPPVRSVLLTIEALELEIDLKGVDLFEGEHLSEAYLKVNPMHTVPTFRDNAITLTDSHAIVLYLCEKYDRNGLWLPTDLTNRYKVINRLFFDCSILFKRDSDAMNDLFIRRATDIAKHIPKINEAYDFLEEFLSASKYMALDTMTVADLVILATVSTLDILRSVTDKHLRWPLLSKWFTRMQSLPFYGKANQIGLDKLKMRIMSHTNFEINSPID